MRWMLIVPTVVVLSAAALAQAALPAGNSTRVAPAAIPAAPAPRAAPAWKNTSWLNTDAPLTLAGLKGRVVLLNFWVFTCYNCTNTVPSLVKFDADYRDRGLTIVGIHTPEFPPYAGEHDKGNVEKALRKYGIRYPIAQDNDNATWDLYKIRYWPSFVLIDKQGRIRYEGHGEFHVGDQWHTEWAQRIETLLAEDAGEVIGRNELVSLVRHRSGTSDSLALIANPGVKISALLPPSIVRGEQSRISFDAPGRTADSAYFVGAPSASIAGVGAVRGTLVTSACVAQERVCRQVRLSVDIGASR